MYGRSEILLRYTLSFLLALVALNAFAGGYYAMSGAVDVPTEWLIGSPFHDYFLPGLILFIVVGGVFLVAAILVFVRLRIARVATFGAVAIVFIWLGAQVAIIGYVSWMQPTTAIIALVILLIGTQLPKYRPSRVAPKKDPK